MVACNTHSPFLLKMLQDLRHSNSVSSVVERFLYLSRQRRILRRTITQRRSNTACSQIHITRSYCSLEVQNLIVTESHIITVSFTKNNLFRQIKMHLFTITATLLSATYASTSPSFRRQDDLPCTSPNFPGLLCCSSSASKLPFDNRNLKKNDWSE